MPEKKSKPTKKVNLDDLMTVVKDGFQQSNDRIDKMDLRINSIEQPAPIQESEHLQPQVDVLPSEYIDACKSILGDSFKFELEKIQDSEGSRITITVPDKYRSLAVMNAHKTHFQSMRKNQELSIRRQDPKITLEEVNAKMALWDEGHPASKAVPDDKRSIVMTRIKSAGDLKKWLLLVRENIRKEMAVEKGEEPIKSLEEELA